MKLYRKMIMHLSIIMFICLLVSAPNEISSFNEIDKMSLSYYTVHDPIEVLNDTAFTLYGFDGAGTEENPYIIENYKIESFGFLSNGIYVTGTTAHFIIRNCYLLAEYIGINVHAVASNTAQIINNTCIGTTEMGGGIGVSSTTGCSIINNTCSNHACSIHTNEVDNIIIRGNLVSDCLYHGIGIRYTSSTDIIGNEISNCSMFGVAIVGGLSNFNYVYHNIFIDNGKVETYNIDNERFGEITSQAYDEGFSNTWYDEGSKTGNYYSDYSGRGDYLIDGPSESVDIYPQKIRATRSPYLFIMSIVTLIALTSIRVFKRYGSK